MHDDQERLGSEHMVSAFLQALANRVSAKYTRAFDIKWDGGDTLEVGETVVPSNPIKFVKLNFTLGDEDAPRGQE